MMNLVYSFVDGELIGNKTKYFMAFIQLGMSTDQLLTKFFKNGYLQIGETVEGDD